MDGKIEMVEAVKEGFVVVLVYEVSCPSMQVPCPSVQVWEI